MKTIEFESWECFEQQVSIMFSDWRKLKAEGRYNQWATPRFRGHADSDWKLETTLERFTKKSSWAKEQYFKIIRDIQPAVISITGKNWDILEFEDGKLPLSGYEFMIYLRHHGFPSPLLDWTRSPYVAAFFAFRSQEKLGSEKVAIYSYIEDFEGSQGIANNTNEPTVRGLGPYAVTHKRHYAQQCEYSICEQKINGKYHYGSHENLTFGDPNSDLGPVKKYILPGTERTKALSQLHRMNVTAFSLFGSEESLMETLAYQEIETRLID
ncbi:MAG: FRG domain-containing protein [Nitrospirota bacterium]|jgi:hypothetical protein